MYQNFNEQVAALRPQLVSLARRKLRNEAWAEDAVSDTILAALERPMAFAGHSQLRTWLVGVLKHKLVDQLRHHGSQAITSLHSDEGDELPDDGVQPGHAAVEWRDPAACVQEKQMLIRFDACLRSLPAQQAKAFVLRDCMELDTQEVCKTLGISAGNLSVMLHRTRRRLREAVALT